MFTNYISRKLYNLNDYIKNNIFLFVIISILIILLGSWSFLGSMFPLISITSSEFQSQNSWMPLIKAISHGNLFPEMPHIDLDNSSFLFYPYITLWLYGLLVNLIGLKGIIFFSTIIFPVCSFYLLYRIFHRQLNELWSIAISLTCILAFSSWPFRSFLMNLINGFNDIQSVAIQPLEIAHYPIPSLSIPIFLLIFYLSTKNKKLSIKKITLFTILWSLFSQIHSVDALYGLTFWFIYFPIQFYKQSAKKMNSKFINIVLIQILLSLIILLPVIIASKNLLFNNAANNIGFISNNPINAIQPFYFFAYFILPISLTIVVFLVKKADPYELYTKFIHVYILMLVELLLIISTLLFPNSIDIDVLQNRIALFFLHFYYFIPFIYLVTKPGNYTYSYGIESSGFLKNIDKWMNIIFNKFEKIYLPTIIILLFIFAGQSSHQRKINYNKKSEYFNELIEDYKLINNKLSFDSGIIYENPFQNQLIAIDLNRNFKNIWINKFSNNISSEKIIDGLLLYCKIFNWPINKVLQFLSPGSIQKNKGAIIDLSNQSIEKTGIGYWLAFHKYKMTNENYDRYIIYLKDRYNELDINLFLKDFSITHIFATNTISDEIAIESSLEIANGSLYKISN
ncbi:MAG: hypothetical protein CMG74_10515 [Candidatus Marinimicrobia bacterium]|nr:hypothetical protein [Candidatus Neomarinimicrobiota bacterium]|tara:strand:- start:27713 stop:29587 length:1875 start_codon:yes stop_codon:yes gene_type:complete